MESPLLDMTWRKPLGVHPTSFEAAVQRRASEGFILKPDKTEMRGERLSSYMILSIIGSFNDITWPPFDTVYSLTANRQNAGEAPTRSTPPRPHSSTICLQAPQDPYKSFRATASLVGSLSDSGDWCSTVSYGSLWEFAAEYDLSEMTFRNQPSPLRRMSVAYVYLYVFTGC
jgi:hypothetical protein